MTLVATLSLLTKVATDRGELNLEMQSDIDFVDGYRKKQRRALDILSPTRLTKFG